MRVTLGLYWGYIGLHLGSIGTTEKNMETTYYLELNQNDKCLPSNVGTSRLCSCKRSRLHRLASHPSSS